MKENTDIENKDVDDFFKAHLYKQMVDNNAGNTQVMQALFGKLGERIIADSDIKEVISSMSELNDLSNSMQLKTIELMAKMKEVG